MDSKCIISITAFILLPLLLLFVSLFLTIPKSLEAFQRLRHSHKSSDFSLMTFWTALSISFLLFVYLAAIRAAFFYESHIQNELFRIAAGIFITYFIFYFSVPKIHHFFYCWKSTKKASFFSLTILFSLISFYLFSLLTIKFILISCGVLHD